MHIRFGPCLLDLDARQLLRDNHIRHLSPKAFALLAALVEARPRVMTKGELHERLWPDAFVVDANLSNLVAELRAALGDDAAAPRFVRTAHRIGYAFDAAAVVVPEPAARHSPSAVRWIEWGRQRFPLADGVHVVGRDPDADVRFDATTVSRHHARLVVTAEGVILEDLASKNGTYLGDQRVTATVSLADGDAVRFGDVLVTFHTGTAGDATETQVGAPS